MYMIYIYICVCIWRLRLSFPLLHALSVLRHSYLLLTLYLFLSSPSLAFSASALSSFLLFHVVPFPFLCTSAEHTNEQNGRSIINTAACCMHVECGPLVDFDADRGTTMIATARR